MILQGRGSPLGLGADEFKPRLRPALARIERHRPCRGRQQAGGARQYGIEDSDDHTSPVHAARFGRRRHDDGATTS